MSAEVWSAVLAAIPDINAWNANLNELKRLAAQDGPECKAFIAEEAERRGYLWHRDSQSYICPWVMKACTGKLVIGVGWNEGRLAVVIVGKYGHERYESEETTFSTQDAHRILSSPDLAYSELQKNHKMIRVL